MAKIDELVALLTEELNEFKTNITRLEKQSEKIQDIKVVQDTSNIEYLLKEYLKEKKSAIERRRRDVEEINKKIKKARIIPNWLMAFFCVTTSLIVLTLGYYAYEIVQFENKKDEMIEQGKQKMISEFRGYFDKHPEAYYDLRAWAKEQDSIAKSKYAP